MVAVSEKWASFGHAGEIKKYRRSGTQLEIYEKFQFKTPVAAMACRERIRKNTEFTLPITITVPPVSKIKQQVVLEEKNFHGVSYYYVAVMTSVYIKEWDSKEVITINKDQFDALFKNEKKLTNSDIGYIRNKLFKDQ